MGRIMILVFALPIALVIAGAAMIGVTFATVGDGGDAAPQGGDGIAEATEYSRRFTVGVNNCWMQYGSVTRGAAAKSGESNSATGAQPPVDRSTYIRICNFEDEVSVTVRRAGERERSLIGENGCWSQTTQHHLGLIAPYRVADHATGAEVQGWYRSIAPGPIVTGRATSAEMPGGWWNAQLSESIRFCNFAGDITVITENWPSQQWVPNVVPADAIAA